VNREKLHFKTFGSASLPFEGKYCLVTICTKTFSQKRYVQKHFKNVHEKDFKRTKFEIENIYSLLFAYLIFQNKNRSYWM